MKTFLRLTGLVLALIFAANADARAQEFGNFLGCVPTPPVIGPGCNVTGIPNATQQAALPTDLVSLNRITANGLFSGLYVPLSSFASAQAFNQTNAAVANLQAQLSNQSFASAQALNQTNAAVANLQAQVGNLQNQVVAQVSNLQKQVQSFANRSAEISAVAASFIVLPPNPGDRFSLAFGAAGGDGAGAGSVSGAYRLTDNSLLFAGYARGATQSMAKGGMAFSFH